MATVKKNVKAATKSEAKPAKEKKPTIKDLARKLILEKKDNDAIISAVQKAFPDSKFNASHVAFYRNQLRKEGHDLPATRTPKEDKDGKSNKGTGASKKGAADKTKAKVKANRKLS